MKGCKYMYLVGLEREYIQARILSKTYFVSCGKYLKNINLNDYKKDYINNPNHIEIQKDGIKVLTGCADIIARKGDCIPYNKKIYLYRQSKYNTSKRSVQQIYFTDNKEPKTYKEGEFSCQYHVSWPTYKDTLYFTHSYTFRERMEMESFCDDYPDNKVPHTTKYQWN